MTRHQFLSVQARRQLGTILHEELLSPERQPTLGLEHLAASEPLLRDPEQVRNLLDGVSPLGIEFVSMPLSAYAPEWLNDKPTVCYLGINFPEEQDYYYLFTLGATRPAVTWQQKLHKNELPQQVLRTEDDVHAAMELLVARLDTLLKSSKIRPDQQPEVTMLRRTLQPATDNPGVTLYRLSRLCEVAGSSLTKLLKY